MKFNPTTIAQIGENKEMEFTNKSELQNILSGFVVGDYLFVTIEGKKNKRSLASNRFYWKIIDLINKETGNDKDEIHTFFKKKFLPKEFTDYETGDIYMSYNSTAKLNTKEMSEYLDNVIRFTAEFFGIVIEDVRNIDY